ncbi:virulence RhuM family protein [Pasteurella canis]|uniref:virulence RhuM family protein n=1 Tax=Pasteurella canis TaxID=753 RepID=UPI001CC526BD|nr:virulence RhuM family protein [Pasteurella canis]UAY76908.1 virulence RhuM family protein [Pasteurella canis]
MSKLIRNSTAEFLIFTNQIGDQSIEVRYEDNEIWLTQKRIAKLFEVSLPTINEHLKHIFASEELNELSVIRNFRITATDGKNYNTKHYNLDAVISVGYRVNSVRATQFRQWATRVLREFSLKGHVLDRERMENGSFLGEDYFERLLEEIHEIRLSERRFYQKITDIYATAVDYNKDAPTTKQFFATVQNKLHYAIHQHTAAELIRERADSNKPNMGLSTWAKSPDGKILKSDVSVAKNYLNNEELKDLGAIVNLNRVHMFFHYNEELKDLGAIVNAFLDLAERRARRQIPMTMEDWAKRLDIFLNADDLPILDNKGKISFDEAKLYAETEFEKYCVIQDRKFESDFDRLLKSQKGALESNE